MNLVHTLPVYHMPEITLVDMCLILDRLADQMLDADSAERLSDFFHEAELGAKADYLATIGLLIRQKRDGDELLAERQRRVAELAEDARRQAIQLRDVSTTVDQLQITMQREPELPEPPPTPKVMTFQEIFDKAAKDLLESFKERRWTVIEDDDGETD